MRKIFTQLGKISVKKTIIPKNPKKILIFRLGALGDVLMTTPLLRAVREKYRKAEITYLTGKWPAKALTNNKNIDKIMTFDENIIFRKNILEIMKLVKKIKKQKYDMCLVLDKSYLINMLFLVAGIPVRIGFDRNGEGFANTHNVPYKAEKYELDYYLDIVKLLGCKIKNKNMDIFTTKYDRDFSENFFKFKSITDAVVIAPGGAMNPGAVMLEKRWPMINYIKLIKKLPEKYVIILLGGKEDKVVCKDVQDRIVNRKIFNLAGKTSIQQTAEIIKKCKLVITHDSGTMHIAGATDAKLVAIFGPTSPKRFAPKNAIIVESKLKGCPCYDAFGKYNKKIAKRCIESVSVEDVVKKI